MIAGYPVVDLRVVVYDGKHHTVDSKEIAFIQAGKKALVGGRAGRAAQRAGAHRQRGDRGARAEHRRHHRRPGVAARPGQRHARPPAGALAVLAQAPLSELASYQSRLNALTGGQGRYTMAFSHYEPVPPAVQAQLASQYRVKEEA